MNEQQLAEQFRVAVADEPPLGFDPDATIEEAARRQRRRRAMIGSSVATAVVALAAVVGTTGLAARGGHQGAPGSSPSGQTETPPPSLTELEQKPRDTAGAPPAEPAWAHDVLQRMRTVTPQVLRDHVPGLGFDTVDSWRAVSWRRGVGKAYLVDGTERRYVTVHVYHDRDGLDLAGDPVASWPDPQVQLLSDETLADGSHLRVYQGGADPASGTTNFLAAVHLRTDGVIVQADTTMKTEPSQTGLVVDQAVLTAIATDARLTF